MKLNFIEVRAKHLIPDVFIFIPKENRFYYIDDIGFIDKKIILYFEPSVAECVKMKLNIDDFVMVISDYKINVHKLKAKIRNNFKDSDFETLEMIEAN